MNFREKKPIILMIILVVATVSLILSRWDATRSISEVITKYCKSLSPGENTSRGWRNIYFSDVAQAPFLCSLPQGIVRVRGTALIQNRICTKEFCLPESPCCNTCFGGVGLTEGESSILLSSPAIVCKGNSCEMACTGIEVNKVNEVEGIFESESSRATLRVLSRKSVSGNSLPVANAPSPVVSTQNQIPPPSPSAVAGDCEYLGGGPLLFRPAPCPGGIGWWTGFVRCSGPDSIPRAVACLEKTGIKPPAANECVRDRTLTISRVTARDENLEGTYGVSLKNESPTYLIRPSESTAPSCAKALCGTFVRLGSTGDQEKATTYPMVCLAENSIGDFSCPDLVRCQRNQEDLYAKGAFVK